MKVLIINYSLTGGAGIAAFRLHRGLLDAGVKSTMLVQKNLNDFPKIISPDSSINRLKSIFTKRIDAWPLFFYRNKQDFPFSISSTSSNILQKIEQINPDIVHLHWLGKGFLAIKELDQIRRPLVWTLHDSWAFTGGCHLPFDCSRYTERCGNCPQLRSNKENDLSRKIWQKKYYHWQDINLTIISPSRWLAQCAKQSSLFRNRRVEVLPNGINTNVFKPLDKKIARQRLNLSPNKKYILFGAGNIIKDKNKGLHFLKSSLEKIYQDNLIKKIEVIIFGKLEKVKKFDLKLKHHYLGKIENDKKLSLIYSAADVAVMPSMLENLPNIIMESMACGTPCVAFNTGGIPDLVDHKKNGFIAKPFKSQDFKRGILWILQNNQRLKQLSDNSRKKVLDKFDNRKIAKRHQALYSQLIDNP